jgi:hypothetical protein
MQIAQPSGSAPLPEKPIVEAKPVAAPAAEVIEAESDVEEGFEPRGAFLFTSAMLVGFAIYFFIVWLEFTARGGA